MSDDEPFTWDAARSWLDGLPDGAGLNMAYEAVDRHVLAGRGDTVALRLLSKFGGRHDVTYADLATDAARFANVLNGLGVVAGERVFVLTGRIVELYVAVLGALKARCVVCPLFSAFGPDPIKQRMQLGDARVLVTTTDLYERRIAGIRSEVPSLRHVLVVGETVPENAVSLAAVLATASPEYRIAPTSPDTPALLHFTSGTTGTPKGALHVHEAVVAHHATGRMVLDLCEGDVYWCTADPGWVTGTSYGIIAPLACGVTVVVDEGEFDAERWYRVLSEQRVNVWYTAPTAIRMLIRAGDELAASADLHQLRLAASVGEPLNPEAVLWGERVLGRAFRDNWWQTETGGIMIGNVAGLPIRPGSMGKPVPGIEAGIIATDDEGEVQRDADGHVIVVTEPGTAGMLALRAGWPSMFRTYLGQEDRYRQAFSDGWYLSGDLVRRDADGYYWFVARADDVIKTAGHLIGPFEVESALMEHPAVAEAGVYGVPDPIAGALVHAAVVLRPGFVWDSTTARGLMAHARRRLGAAVAPRAFTVVTDLPKTRSGKVMRRVLRARELGLPEGDLSTLEAVPAGAAT